MSEGQIKDMILKQCLELTTNNDFRPPISAYDGIDIDDVVRTCKQLQDKKTYLDLLKENQELKEKLDKYENPEDMTLFAMWCTEKVKDENLELKKQLEEKIKIGVADHKYASKCEDKVITMENQQKEFIEYLEDCINELKKESMNKLENTINLGIADVTKTILSKYKEIIGGKE